MAGARLPRPGRRLRPRTPRIPVTRLLLGLLATLAVGPGAAAQAPAAPAADSTLAPYVGTWDTTTLGTPIGTLAGTLTVAPDGSGVLSFPAMEVQDAIVAGLSGATGALLGTSMFGSPVSGMMHATVITLAPAPFGTLRGTISDSGQSFPMSARRAAP